MSKRRWNHLWAALRMSIEDTDTWVPLDKYDGLTASVLRHLEQNGWVLVQAKEVQDLMNDHDALCEAAGIKGRLGLLKMHLNLMLGRNND